MGEFSKQEIYQEAQCIYDAVSDAAMESGREMPWWSELPEEVMDTYLERAKGKLQQRKTTHETLEKLKESDVIEWLESKGYEVSKYE